MKKRPKINKNHRKILSKKRKLYGNDNKNNDEHKKKKISKATYSQENQKK